MSRFNNPPEVFRNKSDSLIGRDCTSLIYPSLEVLALLRLSKMCFNAFSSSVRPVIGSK